jgi:hypothetical protein
MFKNFTIGFAFATLLMSCASQPKLLTRADLKAVAKYYATDKDQVPQRPMFTLALYNDARLELQGYSQIDKIGGFTTMLNDKEYAQIIAMMKKMNQGHVVYNHPKLNYTYDLLYYPLKKDISMADGVLLENSTDMVLFNAHIDDLIQYKNWVKKEDAPAIFSNQPSKELIVSVKAGGSAVQAAKGIDPKFGAVAKTCLDPMTHTWLVTYAAGTPVEVINALKRNEDVIGVVENQVINKAQNLEKFNEQELIVQFNQTVTMEDWVKTYASQKMKTIKQVAPNMNYYVVSFDSSILNAKEMITLIKKDTKVVEAQTNKKVFARE